MGHSCALSADSSRTNAASMPGCSAALPGCMHSNSTRYADERVDICLRVVVADMLEAPVQESRIGHKVPGIEAVSYVSSVQLAWCH